MTPYFLVEGLDIPVPAKASPGDGGASEAPLTVSGEGGADASPRLRLLEGVSGFVPGSCFTTTVLPARVGRLDSGELDFAESFSLPFSFFAAGRFAGMFLDNPDG